MEDKNVNAAFEASGEDITDADIVKRYEGKIQGMGPHLIGKPELNELVYAYENAEVRQYIYDTEIRKGATTEDAGRKADKKASILLAEAMTSYNALLKRRKNS